VGLLLSSWQSDLPLPRPPTNAVHPFPRVASQPPPPRPSFSSSLGAINSLALHRLPSPPHTSTSQLPTSPQNLLSLHEKGSEDRNAEKLSGVVTDRVDVLEARCRSGLSIKTRKQSREAMAVRMARRTAGCT
jgi:hypothetical protein